MSLVETALDAAEPQGAAPAVRAKVSSKLPVHVAAISIAVLLPVFWQSRIQAGDLSSHLYNAWLAMLIEQGRIQRFELVTQWTNVLFDLLLTGLLKTVGAAAAQRIAVSLCVLNFVWGAFVLLNTVSRSRVWRLFPYIVILAYGWVFHLGLLNFYLSMGLCCWALALLWNSRPIPILLSVPLLGLAYFAHAIPVAWALGSWLYVCVARYVRPRGRVAITVGGLAAIYVLRLYCMSHFAHRWTPLQAISILGVDQVLVFGPSYYGIALALLVLWSSLLLRKIERSGWLRTVLGIPFQLSVLIGAAVFLIPEALMLPGYNHALDYINDRMSLAAGIGFLILVANVQPSIWERRTMAVVMSLYFVLLFIDERSANQIVDSMSRRVAQLPPESRVINGLCDVSSRIHPLAHNLDRVCIGRCWSYGNYEPSSTQFRVRSQENNSLVIDDAVSAAEIEHGEYVVKTSDPPLYQIYLHDARVDVRRLQPGDAATLTCFDATPGLKSLATFAFARQPELANH
jgi:hypothetical protein